MIARLIFVSSCFCSAVSDKSAKNKAVQYSMHIVSGDEHNKKKQKHLGSRPKLQQETVIEGGLLQ